MNYTKKRGQKVFTIWGEPIAVEWKEANFPEREPYYSVKQEIHLPESESPLEYIEWMERHIALMAILYLLDFTIEVAMPNDNVIYWSRSELPW